MTRRQWLIMAGGVAGGVVGVNRIADGVRPAADVIEDVTDLNWLWRWRLHHIPECGPDGTYLTLVLRSRVTPHREAGLPEYSQRPLPVGHGEDRVLGSSGWLTTRETALTLQLLDMRKFGVGTTTPRPLRVQAASAASGMAWHAAHTLHGHTFCRMPVVHNDRWENNELPLLSVDTATTSEMHTYTFVLTVQPFPV